MRQQSNGQHTDDPLSDFVIRPGETIRGAMMRIEMGSVAIALVVSEDGHLLGTVSDGDIRRALLDGATLDDLVGPFVTENPVVVPAGTDRAAVLDLMRARGLNQIPEVESDGRLRWLHAMHEVLGASPKPNRAVVLAGGRGTRLRPMTNTTPKPMLPVAGRPILERIVLHLVGSGIHKIYLSVGHLAHQVRDHFGDGSDLGCSIQYLVEDPACPLGTGGPLGLVPEQPDSLPQPLIVLNGDLVTSFSVDSILSAHTVRGAALTMALREYVHDVPFGVVGLDGQGEGQVAWLEEKPRWVALANAGIYVVEPRLLRRIPPNEHYPITELIRDCIDRGEPVAGWQMTGDWLDIGRPLELAQARGEL